MVEAQKEAQREEELDRQARLGPGGLDPVEVFESLPDVSTYLKYRISLNNVPPWALNSVPFFEKA